MAQFTDKKIQAIWDKAIIQETIIVEGQTKNVDTNHYRQDACNAWIDKTQYGKENDLGWEIDHILPVAKDGTDNTINLRPMHWKNNRSKGDDFPDYTAVLTSDNNRNKEIPEGRKTVNKKILAKLKEIYPNNPFVK